MDHPLRMGVCERLEGLLEDRGGETLGKWSLRGPRKVQYITHRTSIDLFHRDQREVLAPVLPEVVDTHDALVRELAHQRDLAAEMIQQLCLCCY